MKIKTLVGITGLAAAALLLNGCGEGDGAGGGGERTDAPTAVRQAPGAGLSAPDTTAEGDAPTPPGDGG